MTASSDQNCFLWDCQDVSKYYREKLHSKDAAGRKKSKPSVARNTLEGNSMQDSYSVTCADWSSDGKMLAIGILLSILFTYNYIIIMENRSTVIFLIQGLIKEAYSYGHQKVPILIHGNPMKE